MTSIVFLGAGSINRRHIKIARSLRPKWRMFVASRDSAKATSFKRELSLDGHFDGYEAGIASDCEVVVVSVPPRKHLELVRAAADAGKHILLEKPAFNSLDEFAEALPLLAGSRARGKAAMVAENIHFDSFHRTIKRLLGDGSLGRPLHFDLNRVGLQQATDWRADPREMPLGALHEGGVHWIHRVVDLASVFETDFGGVVSVMARGCTVANPALPEDTATVVTRHASGLISRLFHSWGIPKRSRLLDLSKFALEKGTIYFDPNGAIGLVRAAKNSVIPPRVRDPEGYRAMWEEFLSCVETGRAPELSVEQIFYDFRVLDAAYRAMASAGAVTLERS